MNGSLVQNKGKKLGFWYNNGISEKMFKENEQPEGWVKGRLKTNRVPWNKGKKGVQKAWNKGMKRIIDENDKQTYVKEREEQE